MSSFVYTMIIHQRQSIVGLRGQLGKMHAVRLQFATHGMLQAQGLVNPYSFATAAAHRCCATEVVEYSCNLAPDLMGEYIEGVANGMDTYSIKQPLGVGLYLLHTIFAGD